LGFNIEIKARVKSLSGLEPLLASMGARHAGVLKQEDLYFNSPQGRLKIRRTNDDPPELIYYHRADQAGPKASEYQRHTLSDPAQMRVVLESVLGLRGVVRKTRTLYLLDETRIHLDEVEDLGGFIEFEVVLPGPEQSRYGQAKAGDLLEKLGIAKRDLLSGSYIDLITQTRTGAVNAG
jgi:predicted adenylyl cyclase CyaB